LPSRSTAWSQNIGEARANLAMKLRTTAKTIASQWFTRFPGARDARSKLIASVHFPHSCYIAEPRFNSPSPANESKKARRTGLPD
jgi:hypothetical protein